MTAERRSAVTENQAIITTNCSHVIALGLKDVKEQSDAVLRGGNQLPDAVLVGRVLSGPPWTGDGAIQFGDEASAGSWTEDKKQEETRKTVNICTDSVKQKKKENQLPGLAVQVFSRFHYVMSHHKDPLPTALRWN